MGGFFLFPILMERIYGYSETGAGPAVDGPAAGVLAVGPVAGYAAVKVGERWSIGGRGRRPCCVSMLVFTQVGADPSVVLIIVALALSGPGQRRVHPVDGVVGRPTRWRPTSSG